MRRVYHKCIYRALRPVYQPAIPPWACKSDWNVGNWDAWYRDFASEKIGAFRYGDTVTSRMASAFMADVGEVEDWGCGAGGFKRFYHGKIHRRGRKQDAVRRPDRRSLQLHVACRGHRHATRPGAQLSVEGDPRRRRSLVHPQVLPDPLHALQREHPGRSRTTGRTASTCPICRSPGPTSKRGSVGCAGSCSTTSPTDSGYKVEHVYLVWREDEPKPRGRDAVLRRLFGEWLGEATTAVALGLERAGRHDLMRTLLAKVGRNRAPKRTIYTAIFGKYDRLKDFPNDGSDLICFTDDPSLAHPQWQVRLVAPRYGHPRLDAKYYKAMPHVVLPEYDETLWIDGSFRVEDETFASDAFGYLPDTGIALFLHPERGCIYDEAVFCKDMPKYVSQKVLEQVGHYREESYPAGAGLFAGGVIARRTHDPKIRRLNELWMEENVRLDVPGSAQPALSPLEARHQALPLPPVSLAKPLGHLGGARARSVGARHLALAERAKSRIITEASGFAETQAYVGNSGEHYFIVGLLQLELLRMNDCPPDSHVLAIGCGPLVAGRPIMQFLNLDRSLLVARYIESLSRKLTHGAHGFFLIADYDKYNRFGTTGDRHGLKRAVADCFPGAAANTVREDQRTHFCGAFSATRTRTITSIPTAGITSGSRPVSRCCGRRVSPSSTRMSAPCRATRSCTSGRSDLLPWRFWQLKAPRKSDVHC